MRQIIDSDQSADTLLSNLWISLTGNHDMLIIMVNLLTFCCS